MVGKVIFGFAGSSTPISRSLGVFWGLRTSFSRSWSLFAPKFLLAKPCPDVLLPKNFIKLKETPKTLNLLALLPHFQLREELFMQWCTKIQIQLINVINFHSAHWDFNSSQCHRATRVAPNHSLEHLWDSQVPQPTCFSSQAGTLSTVRALWRAPHRENSLYHLRRHSREHAGAHSRPLTCYCYFCLVFRKLSPNIIGNCGPWFPFFFQLSLEDRGGRELVEDEQVRGDEDEGGKDGDQDRNHLRKTPQYLGLREG